MFKKINFPLLMTCFILTVLPISEAWARAGGGRNGGGGILYLILAPFFMVYAWYINRKINQKKAQVDVALDHMARKDSAWDEGRLEKHVRTSFIEIENAWCDQDLKKLKGFLDFDLYEQWVAQLKQMGDKGWKNVMDGLTLEDVRIVEAVNRRKTEEDSFTACIDASAADYTVNAEGKVVDSNSRSSISRLTSRPSNEKFREFWTYRRHNDDWLLSQVDQASDWKKSVEAPIVDED